MTRNLNYKLTSVALVVIALIFIGAFVYAYIAYTGEVSTLNQLSAQKQALQAQLADAQTNIATLNSQVSNSTSTIASLQMQLKYLKSFSSALTLVTTYTKVVENNSNSFTAFPNSATDVGAYFNAPFDGYVLVNVTNLSQTGVTGVEFLCHCVETFSGTVAGITLNFPISGTAGIVVMPVYSGDVFVFIKNSASQSVTGTISIIYYHM